VGQIQKEWLFAVRFDELERPFGVAFRQSIAMHGRFDHGFVLHQRQGRPVLAFQPISQSLARIFRHVIAVGNAEERIKPLPGRKKLRLIAQMPFADDAGFIALSFEHFRNRNFLGVQSIRRHRTEDLPIAGVIVQAHPLRVTACHQAGS
jgi:hypothetical protein